MRRREVLSTLSSASTVFRYSRHFSTTTIRNEDRGEVQIEVILVFWLKSDSDGHSQCRREAMGVLRAGGDVSAWSGTPCPCATGFDLIM